MEGLTSAKKRRLLRRMKRATVSGAAISLQGEVDQNLGELS